MRLARAVMIHVVSSCGSRCVAPAVVCTCNSRKEKHRAETKRFPFAHPVPKERKKEKKTRVRSLYSMDGFSDTVRLRTKEIELTFDASQKLLMRKTPRVLEEILHVSNRAHIYSS